MEHREDRSYPAVSRADAGAPRRRGRLRRPGVAHRSGLRVGSVLGFPVYLSPSWLILAALVTIVYGERVGDVRPHLAGGAGYALGAAFVLGLVGSVLLHELGHALVSRRMGTGVKGITLELLGGYTEMERDAPRPAVETLVSLAGPAVSLGLALAAAGVASVLPAGALAAQFVGQLALSNAIIAVFNALPGLPLDGGRALQAVVWAVTGDVHRGRRVAGRAGQGLAVACFATGAVLHLTGRLSLLGLVFTLLVAGTVWFGAAGAVRLGRVGARVHLIDLDRLARPIFRVPAGTPLREAQRRAADAGMPEAALAVVGGGEQLRALVHDVAAAAVPDERRAWITVDEVARQIDPNRALPAGLRGGEVLRAVEADPVGEYLVTAGEDVIGILRMADLAHALDSATLEPPKA